MSNTIETSDGLRFERLLDGSVHLRAPSGENWVIHSGAWAAVVAGVSARGNNEHTRSAALIAHQAQGPTDDFPTSKPGWDETTVPSRKVEMPPPESGDE